MLSRVADSLYWMSRYLERAEHTVRMVDVNFGMTLDRFQHYRRCALAALPGSRSAPLPDDLERR